MPSVPLPGCEPNPHFTTKFDPFLKLPGFFPGAGGFFHGHEAGNKRILIFGTDFGPLSYQRGLALSGGEPIRTRTIANLRGVLGDAGIPLNDCFLTNQVLCMWLTDDLIGNHQIWRRYSGYVEACAAWHRAFIKRHQSAAIVLMGTPPLLTFGRTLFPELADYWRGLNSLHAVYAANREVINVPAGPRLLLMPHASLRHPNAAQRPHIAARAIEHLKTFA